MTHHHSSDRKYLTTCDRLCFALQNTRRQATSIAFVENQPSPSLISLSPLPISHSRALQRSRIRPCPGTSQSVHLGVDHLVSGAIRENIPDRFADPLYKRYLVSSDCEFESFSGADCTCSRPVPNFPSQYYSTFAHLVLAR